MNTQPFPSHISARLRLRSLLACASLLALAAPLAMAQLFSGTYTFGNEGNVTSFPYNGTSITDLTVGNLVKTGITSSSSMGNYRGSNWPTGATTGSDVFTGALDTGKYIEFSLTAAPGKLINLPTLTFGVGRSGTGPRQWQWRSSVDSFTNPIPVITVNGSLTHDAGVLTNLDSDSSWTGNIITTSTAAYQNLTSITFRLYGYNSETTIGTAGLQGDLTFGGTLVDTAGILTLSVNPSTFSESASNPAATGTLSRTGDLTGALEVNLLSSDTTEATVPATVIIPANESEATFHVTAVDDNIPDGPQTVVIASSALGYVAGTFTLTVTDDGDEIPAPTLPPGAIAFVGYNADGNNDLAFVALTPIAGGDTILFTGNEWNGQNVGGGGEFNTGEGFLIWTAPEGGVPAGTIITLNSVRLSSTNANLGTLTRSGNFSVNAEKETIHAYQGNIFGASGFLAVIATHNADSTAGTGLASSHIIYLPNDVDVAVYTGSRSNQSTYPGYLDLIVDTASNWITQDGSGDQSNDGFPPDVPFNTTPFTLSTGGNTFADWIGGYPAVGGLTGFNDDFDNDGLVNALENILGSSPAVANQGLTSVVAGAGTLSFRHTRNTSPASDLAASYEWSVNLANWNASGASVGGTTVTFAVPVVITPGMEGAPDLVQVTATVSGTPATKVFARLRVNQVAAP